MLQIRIKKFNLLLYGYINYNHHYLFLVKRSFSDFSSDSSSGDDKDLTKDLLGTDSSVSSKKKRNPGKRKKDLDSSKVTEEVKKKSSKKINKEKPSLDDSSNVTVTEKSAKTKKVSRTKKGGLNSKKESSEPKGISEKKVSKVKKVDQLNPSLEDTSVLGDKQTQKSKKSGNKLISPFPRSRKSRKKEEREGNINYYGNLNENSSYFSIYKYYRRFHGIELTRIKSQLDEDSKEAEKTNNLKLSENYKYRISIILDIKRDREFDKKIIKLPSHRISKCSFIKKKDEFLAYLYSRYYAELSQTENSILLEEKKNLEFQSGLLNNADSELSIKIEALNDVISDRDWGYIL
jgi:hypothetical protein